MKKLLVLLLLVLTYNISLAQSGWGYVNYTSYKTHNGNGVTNQYSAFANTSSDFVTMFNTTNSNTTIFRTGETTLQNIATGSFNVPRWASDYFGYKFEFFFIPQETGTYTFGVNSDDASDLLIDGVVVTSYYGGHGASGYQYGQINLIAGRRYSVVARFQEYGGGEAFYLHWSKPSAPQVYSYWTNEVTNVASVPTKQAKINFDFGSNLDKTKLSVSGTTLSSTGVVDVTNSLDTTKIPNGYKSLTTPGSVEWAIIDVYSTSFGGHRLYIDAREFDGTGISPSDVKSIQLFDIYDGPITYVQDAGGWKIFRIVPNISTKITSSTYQSYLRLQNGWYGTKAEFTFNQIQQYKPQSVIMTTNSLSTLYNSVVTVSDVYLAFKELSNGGILGNQNGLEFTNGVQYMNADVNGDGIFNESDTYRLLQHLTGFNNIVDTFTFPNLVKLVPTQTYNTIGKSNWNTFPKYIGNTYVFDINTTNSTDVFNISGTWLGDINLSHSAQQSVSSVGSNSIRTMSLVSKTTTNEVNVLVMSENVGNKLIVTLSVDPLEQELVGTQFQLNYDNAALEFQKIEFTTKGNPTNFGTDKGDNITLGSLITDGSTILDKTTEYKITFLPKMGLSSILGLTSISTTDAVNKGGTQLKVKLK
jgi:hypothetical protein